MPWSIPVSLKLCYDEVYDECPCCTWDDTWHVVSFNRRHRHYEDPNKFLPPDIGLRRKLDVGTAFLLSYYEHGMCRWSLQGEGPQCRWDTAQCAGILLWKDPVSHLGPKTYTDRQADARSFLEIFTAWCNGSVYYYVVEELQGKKAVDACGGFYTTEDLFDAVACAVGDGTVVELGGDYYKVDPRGVEHDLEGHGVRVRVA